MNPREKLKIGELCSCGKVHISSVEYVEVGKGVLKKIPEYVCKYSGKKVFLIADVNTYAAAAKRVASILREANIDFSEYVFSSKSLEPNENAVGSAIMHFKKDFDILIGVGSGTVNDICKIVSKTAKVRYIIVGTAPSMDGYASATSSVVMDGLKVSLPSRCPDVIIGDTEILCDAPEKMLVSGLGDMIAKYISIAEWRVSNLINGEYYCEDIAEYIREALRSCTSDISGLLERKEKSVENVFLGLIKGGCAMEYAGLSRPASGIEHYISHVLDMRGEEFGTPTQTHGIQCAVGTLLSARLYHKLKSYQPNKKRAESYVSEFDFALWSEELRSLLGKGAESMIAAEKNDGKYSKIKHGARLATIINNWSAIVEIIEEEIPEPEKIEEILSALDCPKTLRELEVGEELFSPVFKATKDIRDKYVLSRLLWDLGIIEEYSNEIK